MAHNSYHNNINLDENATITEFESFKVNSFEINTSEIQSSGSNRRFLIKGERGASFNINIVQKSESASVVDKFYDFTTNTFVSSFNKNTTLKAVLKGKTFSTFIKFPGSYTGQYIITAYAEPSSKTTFNKSAGVHGQNIYIRSINQSSNVTLTFSPSTSNTSNYQAFSTSAPSATIPYASKTEVVATAGDTTTNLVKIRWMVRNVENDSHGFGLRLTSPTAGTNNSQAVFTSSSWFFEKTVTTGGAIGTEFILSSLTDISAGMVIVGVSSGSLEGTPQILGIDEVTNTITISTIQEFADGITLTIRALGKFINYNSDLQMSLDFKSFNARLFNNGKFVKTVRTSPTNATVNLNGTYGVMGGGHATISGLNVNNSAANTVQSVSASSSGGSVTVQLDQTGVLAGTEITFNNTDNVVVIEADIAVLKHPSSNRTINLNLDDFITVGAAS